jgi:predicted DNA-binding protein
MNNVVATRFPEDIITELDAVARERKRTRAEIIREAVDIYLKEWAEYAIALDRLRDPNDAVLSHEEFWDEVEQDEDGSEGGAEPARG